MLDTRFSWVALFVLLISFTFPFFPQFIELALAATAVRGVENIQVFMLFAISVFTVLYMRPWDMPNGQKHFWLWATCWWLLLCGRSMSWGRDYFPEVPKVYFRGISVILIGSVVFMLFSPHLRQEITQKFKTLALPIWAMGLAVFGLLMADAIENYRAIAVFLVQDAHYANLIEELYEFPLIIGLFLTAYTYMQRDQKLLAHERLNVNKYSSS